MADSNAARAAIRSMVDRNKIVARQAVASTYKALGLAIDPDLRVYNRLQPEDFEVIRGREGDGALLDYIVEMERRLMGDSDGR